MRSSWGCCGSRGREDSFTCSPLSGRKVRDEGLDQVGLQLKPALSALGISENPNGGGACAHVTASPGLPLQHVYGTALTGGSITQLRNTEVS